jgi:hypothetical protein
VSEIKAVIVELPAYGYRRVHAILKAPIDSVQKMRLDEPVARRRVMVNTEAAKGVLPWERLGAFVLP